MPFARILRSSALMGGAQAATLATSFIRAKVIAVIFGTAGIGLFGILSTFNANLSAIAGWGLGISGVRAISSATPDDKSRKIAAVLRLGKLLAWGGLLLTLSVSYPCSVLVFGDARHALDVLIAGLAVPLVILTGVFSAIVQARGDLPVLARMQVIGAVAGMVAGLPFIWLSQSLGIAIAILLASAVPAFLSWRAAKKYLPTVSVPACNQDIWQLVSLGAAFMASGLFSQISVLVVRTSIVHHLGLGAAGLFHAANAVAMSLPSLVLASMGTDCFPRLAAAESEDDARRLTETQIKTALIFSLPLLCILLTLGQACLRLLYASKGFDDAAPLLSWMTWGVFLRVIAWPMGYWLMARGSSSVIIGVDALSTFLACALPLVLLPHYGLTGAAAAFFAGCLAYACILLVIVRVRIGAWLSFGVFGWCAMAAFVLALAQMSVASCSADYWGVIPTALVTLGCVTISYRLLRKRD